MRLMSNEWLLLLLLYLAVGHLKHVVRCVAADSGASRRAAEGAIVIGFDEFVIIHSAPS
jgi:hypothetical protein